EADLAAVVGVGPHDVVIARVERNLGVPQAGQEAPARHELPFALRVERGAVHSVVLIAFQRPGGAEVIEVAPAPLLLTVVIASHGEREGPACELRRARPAHIQPVIEAVEVDDAARRGRRILRHDGNCQKLLDLPASAVDGKAQAVEAESRCSRVVPSWLCTTSLRVLNRSTEGSTWREFCSTWSCL